VNGGSEIRRKKTANQKPRRVLGNELLGALGDAKGSKAGKANGKQQTAFRYVRETRDAEGIRMGLDHARPMPHDELHEGQETKATNTDGEDGEGSFCDIEFGHYDIEISGRLMAKDTAEGTE
jgi:hypothetical protein